MYDFKKYVHVNTKLVQKEGEDEVLHARSLSAQEMSKGKFHVLAIRGAILTLKKFDPKNHLVIYEANGNTLIKFTREQCYDWFRLGIIEEVPDWLEDIIDKEV